MAVSVTAIEGASSLPFAVASFAVGAVFGGAAATLSANSEVLPAASVAVAVSQSASASEPAAKVNENWRALGSIVPGVAPLTMPAPMKI